MTRLTPFFLLFIAFIVFSGCGKEDEVSSVVVTSIILNDYPMLNGSEPWDTTATGLFSGPDIYWSISGPEDFISSNYIIDATGEMIEFNGSDFPIELTKPDETYTLEIFNKNDLDDTDQAEADELMISGSLQLRDLDCPNGVIFVLQGSIFVPECL